MNRDFTPKSTRLPSLTALQAANCLLVWVSGQYSISCCISIGHSCSHTVRWSFQISDAARVLSEALFGHKTTSRPVLEPVLLCDVGPPFYIYNKSVDTATHSSYLPSGSARHGSVWTA